MAPDYVALDLARLSDDRREVAAVARVGETTRAVVWILGYEALTAEARQHDARAEVRVAASLDEVAQGLVELAGDTPWVTYDLADALGDWVEQDGTGVPEAVPQCDAGDLAALTLPGTAGRSLEAALGAVGLEPVRPARGLDTALAIAALWDALPAAIAARPYAVRHGLIDLLERGRHPLAPYWKAAASGSPGGKDALHLDSLLRQRLRELTPPAPEAAEPGDTHPIDVNKVSADLAPDGPVAARMGQYEERPGQIEMARAVAGALNGGRCLLVEAGTGTGKSIAYLAPALRFAVHNNTVVVVSTNTKNLQDQLCRKDLPLLKAALDFEFQAELIKGRGNYLCVEKLLREYADAGLLPFDDQLFYLAYLLSWAEQTEYGDLDDLSGYLTWRYPRLESYARGLASDSESCTAHTARNHPCFASYARRRAVDADLLVVNHALALANTTVEVLPPFRHLVLDEAHNLEDIATEAFGLTLERRELHRLLREVAASRDARSFTNRCRHLVGELKDETATDVLESLTAAEQAAEEVMQSLDSVGEQWAGVIMRRLRRTADELQRAEKLRLDPTIYEGDLGGTLHVEMSNLRTRMGALTKALTSVSTGLQQVEGDALSAAGIADATAELQAVRLAGQARMQEWTDQLRSLDVLLALSEPKYVFWVEFALRREAWDWRLRAAPIEAGEELAEHLYRQMDAVVLTSATLTVDGRFDYFAHRLGLNTDGVKERYDRLQVPSNFDYQRQVLLGMPINIATPKDERFERHVTTALEDVIRILDGRTLILFTSLQAMRRAHEALGPRLEALGIEALCQGVNGSRHALAERFRRNEHSVLFGTRSFWEGIDVPGDALQCVVIVKLPFTVPDDPVHEARCEHLEARGINAWSAYSVPQAVILFKQGFGRLIRTATDRGAVIVLDRRLKEMSYGRAFLRSVPGYSGVFDTWTEVKARLREWFATPRPEPAGPLARNGRSS